MSLPTHLLILSVGRLWEPQSTSHLLKVVGYIDGKHSNPCLYQQNPTCGLSTLFINQTFITLKKHSLFFPELKVNRRPNIGDPDSTLVCYNILKSPFYSDVMKFFQVHIGNRSSRSCDVIFTSVLRCVIYQQLLLYLHAKKRIKFKLKKTVS